MTILSYPDRRKPRLVFTIGKGLYNQTGGSQKSVCEVASLFARAGYHTTIIFSQAGVSRYDKPRFALDSRVQLINASDWQESSNTVDGPSASESGDWARALEHARPDLLIIWFVTRKAIFAVHDFVRSRNIPFICAHRMDPAHDLLGRPGKGKEAVQAEEILHQAAIHAVQAPDYIDFFPASIRDKVRVTPNIVPRPTIQHSSVPDDLDNRKIILNVGRLHAQKNQMLLVRSFACIADLFEEWDVHIYGDGPDQEALNDLIAFYSLQDRVFLKGLRDDLSDAYSRASIFSFPSIFEGFSRAHSEAMSYRLPSVGLRACASSRWLIGESGGGILTDGSVPSYYAALARLLSSQSERASMGERASKFVERFEEDSVFAVWEGLVRSVVPVADSRTPLLSRKRLRAKPRHVAFSIGAFKSYVGGAEKSLAEIASYLASNGTAVTIIMSEEGAAEAEPAYYPLDANVRLKNLYPWLEEGSASTVEDKKAFLKQRAKQVVHEVNPDLLICFTMEKSLLYANAVQGTDIPYIIAHRNDPEEKLNALVGKAKDKSAYMRDIFWSWDLAAAQTVQLEAYKSYFPADVQEKIVSIPNVILPVEGKDHVSEEGRSDVILNVGRLHPQKNQELLVRAFAELAAEFPSWQVHIYGEGPERGCLEELIASCGMTGRIILKGTTQEMDKVYRQAKLFAFPSVFEGFSRAHGEAMAYGLPSVGLEQCVCSRTLIGESGAGIITGNSVAKFSNALRSLLEDREKRLRYRQRAITYVQEYAPASIHKKWQALIDSVARKD